ncbi:MAG: hypothetical protein R3B47_04085 [Bacteroidia bacterium]
MNARIGLYVLILVIFTPACGSDPDPVQPESAFIKTFGGGMDDAAQAGIFHDASFYVFGWTKSFGEPNGDHYLIKTNPQGDLIWEKRYGGTQAETGKGIKALSNGNLLLWGSTRSSGAGEEDIHIMSVDTDGNLLWERVHGGPEYDSPDDALELPNGDICIAATTVSYGAGSKDMYVLWLDPQGNLIRSKTFGGPDLDGCTRLLALNNGELMLHGYTRNFGAISRDLFLLKLNSEGDSLWSKRIGGDGYEQAEDCVKTPEGGFLFSSHSASIEPNHDMYAVKLDAEGNILWEKYYGGSQHDGGEAVLINPDGNYVFAGRSMSFGNGDQAILLITTSPQGEIISSDTLGGPGSDWAEAILSYQNYYVLIGHSSSYGGGDEDVYIEKYIP